MMTCLNKLDSGFWVWLFSIELSFHDYTKGGPPTSEWNPAFMYLIFSIFVSLSNGTLNVSMSSFPPACSTNRTSHWSRSFNLGIKHFGAVAVRVQLNTVVSGINACICLIALHIWPPDLRVQQLQDFMGLLFYRDPDFSHLLYRTFSLKNVASIVTQFDLLSCLFSAFKSKKEYFKCT